MAATRRKSSATSRLRNGAHEQVDAVADSIDSLQKRATDYVEQGRDRATGYARSVEERIHDRPVLSLLAAAAVGFVFGCFLSRR